MRINAIGFRPLSWGLSFNDGIAPFIYAGRGGFRPLSWGLSFNRTNRGISSMI